MNGYIMLKSTHRILIKRRRYFEMVIKKNKYSDKAEQIKGGKIGQALIGAKIIAPYLRNYFLFKNYKIPTKTVIFGCTIYLGKEQELKEITILGEADVKFNPRYRSKKEFIAYGSDESLRYIGKRIGCIVDEWKLIRIERFKEE